MFVVYVRKKEKRGSEGGRGERGRDRDGERVGIRKRRVTEYYRMRY